MQSNTCPHCKGTPCLPAWRKLTLGPAASTRCRLCGYKISADVLRAWASLLPLLLLTVSVQIGILSDAVAAVFLLLTLLPLCLVRYLVWFPLRPNEVTDRRLGEAARKRIAGQKQGRGGEK
ncbi:MAG TPA: hypothetical protein VFO40_22845 [Chthoniobacterales bacterium]|nr:hypothetical protein [Chthoniobacterales bacterium]